MFSITFLAVWVISGIEEMNSRPCEIDVGSMIAIIPAIKETLIEYTITTKMIRRIFWCSGYHGNLFSRKITKGCNIYAITPPITKGNIAFLREYITILATISVPASQASLKYPEFGVGILSPSYYVPVGCCFILHSTCFLVGIDSNPIPSTEKLAAQEANLAAYSTFRDLE